MKYKVILLFGAPGSGKGTQGKALGAIPGFRHTATGDIFRALDRNSDMGRVFMQYSTRGELVPDEFVIKVFQQHIENLQRQGQFDAQRDILIMDGIPRSLTQARLLADTIDVLKIVYLVASDPNEMVQRLKGRALKENRPDDADEKVIRNRLNVYESQTQPVLDFYPTDKVARINAVQPMLRVLGDIVQVLAPAVEQA
jgi:adenylate kinase